MNESEHNNRRFKPFNAKGLRVKANIPINARGLCIIVPSGHMGKYDQEGAEGEKDFYSSIFSILPANGFGVIQPDMPIRLDLNKPASKQHLKERELIFTYLLELPLTNQFTSNQVVILGMSLGGEVVLDNLHKQFAGVILIGSVIDREIPKNISVKNIHLLYGSDDYIAYVGADGIISPLAPEVYSKNSVEILNEAGAKNVETTILTGYGHTLARKEKVSGQPEKVVLSFVQKCISNGGV